MDRKATPSASTRTTRRAVDRLTLAKWALAAALLGAFAAYLWSNRSELGRLRDISGATASYVLAARLIAYWAQASATARARADSTSDARSSAPSSEPSSGSTACSGCGIRPRIVPVSSVIPATLPGAPLGFSG